MTFEWLNRCWFTGHKWGKWIEYKRIIEWVDMGYETDEVGQKRQCEKCGFVQRKIRRNWF